MKTFYYNFLSTHSPARSNGAKEVKNIHISENTEVKKIHNLLYFKCKLPSLSLQKIKTNVMNAFASTAFKCILPLLFGAVIMHAQQVDYTRAPNSYVFNPYNDTHGNGLYIPVKKAYAMWETNYLNEGETMPVGTVEAKVYWEDVPGLIRNLSIEGTGDQAKIKVEINKAKGEGNALVSYHINGEVYWSWHVWVTDDPTDGVSYGHNTPGWEELDGEGNPFTPKFMDRNLGAVSNDFRGDDWNKSGGLMYQWGRKDPFPPLKYKDESFYTVRSEVHNTYFSQNTFYSNVEQIPFVDLPSSEPTENLKYAVQNPLDFIRPSANLTWWGSNGNNFPQDDMWASATLGNPTDNPTYKNKSPYDPCPNGWRVPSYRAVSRTDNVRSPWGADVNFEMVDGYTDLLNISDLQQSSGYLNSKIYPSLGVDFSSTKSRAIGMVPLTGAIYGEFRYLDNISTSGLWGATPRRNTSANSFKVLIDAHMNNVSEFGQMYANPFIEANIKAGAAVRCIQDPNVNLAEGYDFPTEYFGEEATDILRDFSDGVDNPNSYIVINDNPTQGAVQLVPLKKAYAMYNQYLTDHEWPNPGQRAVSVYWTDNTSLINQVTRTGAGAENDEMTVILNENQFGNAVVALHEDGIDSDVIWSWHIWVPKEDPRENTYTHTTEPILQGADPHIVNPTRSGLPTITTEFMPMNLGALNEFPSINNWASATPEEQEAIRNSGGLHYQWGRKDPLPAATKPGGSQRYNIYRQVDTSEDGIVYGNAIHDINSYVWATTTISSPSPYNANYTETYAEYAASAGVQPQDDRNVAAQKVLKYATANPLTFLYQESNGCVGNGPGCEGDNSFYDESLDWISDERGLLQNRWGHASKKSPFDPCPEGWRVPDTTMANATEDISTGPMWYAQGSRGTSPWFFSKANRTLNGEVVTDFGIALFTPALISGSQNYPNGRYPGKAIQNPGWPLNKSGWIFQHDDFKIGNIPATGIRGSDGGNDFMTEDPTGQVTIDTSADYYYRAGLWTSSISSTSGHAIALEIHNARLRSGSIQNPMASMNVRCAKHKDADFGGIDYRVRSPQVNSSADPDDSLGVADINQTQTTRVNVYPNPAVDFVYITQAEEVSSWNLYDTTGKLVIQGNGNQNTLEIYVDSLPSGVYFLQVIFEDGAAETHKVLKK